MHRSRALNFVAFTMGKTLFSPIIWLDLRAGDGSGGLVDCSPILSKWRRRLSD